MRQEKQPVIQTRPVRIPAGVVELDGDLTIPANAEGLVVFAHGSGSSRKSPRNRFVAETLNRHHQATLLADLLTPDEEAVDNETRHLRFDIPFLAKRLSHMLQWAADNESTRNMNVGCFGASTGAAAALITAAYMPKTVKAVVSRGGRPDLADEYLQMVKAPTLLVVGTRDPEVLHLNREALKSLNKDSALRLVHGASHLFEEPGTLAQVAELAAKWFAMHLE
ncbi:MAG TPA: alpha/beta family hydrolase [Patescibacteria group bacterium]|jgi:dienelactone hydrolase|nr:alpha/beta family hydrolase [Patescibacteria group bacterium]